MSLTVFSRQRLSPADEAVAALKAFMESCADDRLLLLTILRDGKPKFINVLRAETRGLPIDDAMLEKVWCWLEARKGVNPEIEREWLEIERRNQTWKDQAIERCVERLEIAARHNLRVKGDSYFDGEKITTGEDDPRLPSRKES